MAAVIWSSRMVSSFSSSNFNPSRQKQLTDGSRHDDRSSEGEEPMLGLLLTLLTREIGHKIGESRQTESKRAVNLSFKSQYCSSYLLVISRVLVVERRFTLLFVYRPLCKREQSVSVCLTWRHIHTLTLTERKGKLPNTHKRWPIALWAAIGKIEIVTTDKIVAKNKKERKVLQNLSNAVWGRERSPSGSRCHLGPQDALGATSLGIASISIECKSILRNTFHAREKTELDRRSWRRGAEEGEAPCRHTHTHTHCSSLAGSECSLAGLCKCHQKAVIYNKILWSVLPRQSFRPNVCCVLAASASKLQLPLAPVR